MTRPISCAFWASACLAVFAARAGAADWPTYRGDAARSGYTAEALPAELSLRWTYRPSHRPQPAWSGRDTRMPFDRAYHPVVADGLLFFGGSADDKVYALDAAGGTQRWTFFTAAPVRFPPTVSDGRVFACSDDGFLYCLAAGDGRLLWKLRGGPADDVMLGNGRVVSRWPARGAPVVADGVVYFGAGIWPSEGIYLYALDAASGKVLWCNDRCGRLSMPQPHPTAIATSGVSAQGHLVVAGDLLLVPTGRAVPAAFRRGDGKLVYFHLQENTRYGGATILAAGDHFFNGGAAFDLATGARSSVLPGLSPLVTASPAQGLIHWQAGKVQALDWKVVAVTDRKGNTTSATGLAEAWSTPAPYGGTSLVVAGKTAVSAGRGAKGHGVEQYGVCVVDLAARQAGWSAGVDALPRGLAVAGGRLYVATEKGTIYCFDASAAATPSTIEHRPEAGAYSELGPFQAAAEEILRQSGLSEGYCLDLGCGDGALAYCLARQSKLHVVAIDPDPKNVALARRRLDAAGLYGVRVSVRQGDPTRTPFPDYLADLVVSGRSVTGPTAAELQREAGRIARPYGGVTMTGRPGAMRKTIRGPLEGAGTWTHQYCDPANTNCSADTLVHGPLGMLWFTDFGLTMPSRHGRGRAPLFLDGRLFIEGRDAVLCVDAYNGHKLWEYPLPGVQQVFDGDHLMGVSGTGSNMCVGPAGLFIHDGARCLRLDPASGTLLATFEAPRQPDGAPGTWGVIACQGETLFGTLANTEHLVTYRYQKGDMRRQYTESMLLFAMDAGTGRLKWSYRPQHSIRHNAIAIGGGRVHLIDRAIALGDRHRESRRGVPDADDVHPDGTLVALDAASGDVLWRSGGAYGTVLALSSQYETLLMCYQNWRFKLASERGGRMAAFDAASGRRRWDIKADYLTRPLINDRTIYLQPGAWDLLTGRKKDFTWSRSYGCGIPAGSKRMMVYRSATLGYLDLECDHGTENYGGIRPGCWINTLPAGGLVLMPDATDRCTCSYLNKASVALVPYEASKRPLVPKLQRPLVPKLRLGNP